MLSNGKASVDTVPDKELHQPLRQLHKDDDDDDDDGELSDVNDDA